MTLVEMERFHYLYERSSADLARMATFSAEGEAVEHVQSLVARAYGEIHSTRERRKRPRPLHWFFTVFPGTVRRHLKLLWIAVAITLVGAAFGAFAVLIDPGSKAVIMPFPGLDGNPAERVAREEKGPPTHLIGHQATFSAQLMTHNIRVSIATFGWA